MRSLACRLTRLALACAAALAAASHAAGGEAGIESAELPFSFWRAPFIHPKIIQDLTTWLSDNGDQVVAINLLESQHSNRYYGEVQLRQIPGGPPYVYVTETVEGSDRREEFGYRYVGKTKSGIHVLHTSGSGGGSAVFETLMLVTFECDKGIALDEDNVCRDTLSIRSGGERILVKKLGEIALGDRWDGELRVNGNEAFVGKDRGWFSVSGGTGGGGCPNDRVIRIEIDPQQERVAAVR
jgi:hypothetical protein